MSYTVQTMKRVFLILALVFSTSAIAGAKPSGWRGVVAKVGSDGRVYINAGTSSALKPGALLVVRRPGEAIAEPRTHKILGREPGHFIAELALDGHLGDQLSVCSVTRGGHGLRIGDPVALERLPDPADEDNSETETADDATAAKDDPAPKPGAPAAAKPLANKPSASKVRPARASETTPKSGRCPPGKFLNAATAGHCCWPEQLWSDRARSCIGAPRCPSGYARQSLECVPRAPEPDAE